MRKPWAKVEADVGLKVNVPKWLMDCHKAFVAYALDFWADQGAGVLNPILFEAAFLDPRTSHLAWLEPSEQKKVQNRVEKELMRGAQAYVDTTLAAHATKNI